MTRWKVLIAAVAALAALASLAACASASPVGAVRNATPKTQAQHTAALNFAVTSDASGKPVTSDGTGATDFGAKFVRGTITINGVSVVPDGSRAEGIIQGQYIYAHLLGDAAKAVPLPQPWLKIDLRALANIPGLDLGTISLAGLINPHLVFLFAGGITSAKKVGDETVNAKKVSHYIATIDLRRAIVGLTGDDASLINTDLNAYASPIFSEDIWIDGAGLMRKATFAVTVKALAGKQIHQTVSFEFPSFGGAVDTNLPPGPQTADLSTLLAALAK